MMTLVIILFASVAVIAVPVIVAVFFLRKEKTPAPKGTDGLQHEKSYEITVFSFDAEKIKCMDDIAARRMSTYRDTGNIVNLEDEEHIYKRTLPSGGENGAELRRVTMSAAEVKRVGDTNVLYFFTRISPLVLKSPAIRTVYSCISHSISQNESILLRVTTTWLNEMEGE